MAAATDLSTMFPVLESGYKKENGSSMEDQHSEVLENFKQMKIGKPPRHLSVLRHCMSSARLMATEMTDAMVLNPEMLVVDVAPGTRFSSRVFSGFLAVTRTHATSMVAFEELDAENGVRSPIDGKAVFLPIFRSGSCSEIGPKPYMEDEYVCIDNLVEHLNASVRIASPGAFYGVFDGHGGLDAATFIRTNILKFIVEDQHFPTSVEKAIRSAFVNADHAFADTSSLDSSSGTTALTALIFGRTMLVANVGDCRAVLGKRGRAVELSKDHKPNCTSERLRIEKLGGVIYDGYLNGQLSVARALGDWHMKGAKGSACPLSADPELQETILTEEDEFLIIGCDGLWDVMTSQCAVTMARRELMLHNDPERCSRELVREALKRNTCDNLTVVVVCFSPDPPPRIEMPRSRFRRSISAEGLNFLKDVLDSDV